MSLGSIDSAMLKSAAATLGLPLSDEHASLIIEHMWWVIRTNPSINLTAIVDPDTALRLHVLDSLAAWPEIQGAPAGVVLDLGTGGGYPGLPLAIACGRALTLLDSTKKKIDVLRAFTESRRLPVTCVSARAEEYAHDHGEQHSIVTARAVSSLEALVELAAPLLSQGGHLIALKGQVAGEELDAADKAARICGMEFLSVRRFELPGGEERRAVVVYRKFGDAEIALPRRVGVAQKRPLSGGR